MSRSFIEGKRITDIHQLGNVSDSERAFALAVLAKANLILFREPVIYGKRPDFHVINTAIYGKKPEKRAGKIVEITQTPRRDIHKNRQKREQRDALERSGMAYTFLGGEVVDKLKRRFLLK